MSGQVHQMLRMSVSPNIEIRVMAWPAEGGAVRDSKNAAGPVLTLPRAGLTGLIAATRSDTLGR